MSGPFAVVLDGAAAPGGHFQTFGLLTQPSGTANVHANFVDVVNVIGRPLREEEDDWLDLLSAVYAADLLCIRGHNEEYTRDIHLSIRVRDPDAVRTVIPAVEEVFERLCQDRLTIRAEPWPTPPTPRFPSRRQTPPPVDAVALLSGGLDSASTGAALLDDGAMPCFVSSETAGHVIASQRRVLTSLANRFGRPSASAGFAVGIRNPPESPLPAAREPSQRARTFLFVGVAALIAAARGVGTVTIGENGVMAINAPLTGGRFGPFSTHTAHPYVLERLGEIATGVLGSAVRVHNPSAFETKTEVVRRLEALRMTNVVRETHSCWIARRDIHCGKCVPCVVRRFAVATVGLPDAPYEHDLFAAPWDPSDPANRDLADYITFARTVRDSNDIELVLRFAELGIPGGAAARANAIAMYRRWTRDVLDILGGQPHLAGLVA